MTLSAYSHQTSSPGTLLFSFVRASMGSVYNTSLQLPIIASSSSSLGEDNNDFDFHAPVTSNNIASTEFDFEYDSAETLAQQTSATLTVRNTFEGKY